MEYLLAGSLLGVGLLVNNNKPMTDNTKNTIKNTPDSYNNIYDFNTKKLINNDNNKKKVRFELANDDNSKVYMDTKVIPQMDSYHETPNIYLNRPEHTRKSNEREEEHFDTYSLVDA